MVLCVSVACCGQRSESHHHESEHHHEAEEEHHHHEEGHEEGHAGEIVFSVEQQKAFGIQTEKVTLKPFASVVRASGSILAATGEEATVSATTSGVFHFSGKAPAEGTYLAKGKQFAVINTESVDGGDPVANARAAYETAEREYLRDQELLKDNIIPVSHYDQSKLEYEQAKAAYEALTRSGYGNTGLNVAAPVSGYLQALYVAEGQYVTTGQPLALVSQNRRLQLRAELPDKYYPMLQDIASANFTTADGVTHVLSDLGGKLLSFSRTATDHFLPVTFEFDNKVPVASGSFVDVYLIMRTQADAITVPVDAVTESQGVYSVYVRNDDEDDAFLKRDVTLGASDGINVQILSGLNPGDEVVTKGAIQIRLASVSAVPSGHNHQH